MLKQKIQQNLTQAIKNREELMSSVLRMLLTVILNKEKEKHYRLTCQNSVFSKEEAGIEEKDKERPYLKEEEIEERSKLSDEEAIGVVFSEVKKRKEAILGYKKGNRNELAEKEKKELEILREYLPKQLSEEEIRKLVKGVIKKIGVFELKDIGKVMTELMPQIRGKSDGATVSKIVKELLAS